jgi:hypothetical protein
VKKMLGGAFGVKIVYSLVKNNSVLAVLFAVSYGVVQVI